jgi:hypothetical protein
MKMPEFDAPEGWEYVATVDANDLCNDVYGSDNLVTEKLHEIGSPTGGATVTCTGVAVLGGVASAFGGPVSVVGGASIVGAVCTASAAGCFAEGVFSEQTGCDGVEFEVYVSYETKPAVYIVPLCEGDLFDEDLVDDLEDVGEDAWRTATDIADDLADGIGSLADEGLDLIGL